MTHLPTLLFAQVAALLLFPAGCDGEDETTVQSKPLRLFVFPNEVEPLGQATVAVEVDSCTDCSICLTVHRHDKSVALLGPAGLPLERDGSLVIIPAKDTSTLTSIVYSAPLQEGSELISATLREEPGCSGRIVDTTTARVLVRRVGPLEPHSFDGGAPGLDAGDPTSTSPSAETNQPTSSADASPVQ